MPSPLELLASNSLLKIKSLTARFEFRHHAAPPCSKEGSSSGFEFWYWFCLPVFIVFGFESALGKCFRNKENHIERCEKAISSPAAQEQTKEEQKQASERDIMEKNAAR